MIQRIQSIWLLLAAAAAGLSFRFPFFTGFRPTSTELAEAVTFNATSHIIILFITALLVGAPVILIFLFGNRKLQFRLTLAAILLSLLNIFLYFLQLQKFSNTTISIYSMFSFLVPLFLILAARGIRKDEKLIKSLDRLR